VVHHDEAKHSAYSSARRIISWFWMQCPSSVSATTPAFLATNGREFFAGDAVIAPVTKTFTQPSAAALS
jgi:hypothetical protein